MATNPLYQAWLHILATKANQLALSCQRTQRQYSFADLHQQSLQVLPKPPIHIAAADGTHYFAEIIACWREQIPVLPIEAGSPRPSLPAPLPPLPAEIIHLKRSSGTTGAPSLLLFTAAALQADCDQIIQAMSLTPQAPNLSYISLAHSYGFSNIVLPLLLHGIPVILGDHAYPSQLKASLQQHGPCTIAAVPSLWQIWLRADITELAHIHTAISAAAPLPLATEHQAFHQHQLRIHNFYGSSECGAIAYDASPSPRTDARILGTPLPHIRLQIKPDHSTRIHSPALAHSRWVTDQKNSPQPSRTKVTRIQNSLRLSDQLSLNSHNQLSYHGRQSETITIAGRNASPDEIQAQLQPASPQTPLLVFGIPSRRTERQQDIILLFGGLDPRVHHVLKKHAQHQLPRWQQPRHIQHCPELAPNARGKTPRHQWRSWYLKNRHPKAN